MPIFEKPNTMPLPRRIRLSERIRTGRVLPLIGAGVDDGLLLGRAMLTEKYADYVQYPFTSDRDDLAKIVQFHFMTRNLRAKDAKYDFLAYIKSYLWKYVEAGLLSHCDKKTLVDTKAEIEQLTFSTLAMRLGWMDFRDFQEINVYDLLAALPLPIYITTNYHTFLEQALVRTGKLPRSEICKWHQSLETIDSVVQADYRPSDKEPLVYHLHGIDRYADSLVLLEDDYSQHLLKIASSRGLASDVLSPLIRAALWTSDLILLGYAFDGRDFKNIIDVLIRPTNLRDEQLFIQIDDYDEQNQDYTRKTAQHMNANVYFGTPEQLMYELYINWQNGAL